MNKKILVAFASRAGSTRGVAEAIGENLASAGARADVIPMESVPDVTTYDAVVAGSAIHGGKWLPEAMQFVLTHQLALAARPFAAFLVCMSLATKNGGDRSHVASWLAPVRARVKPVSEGLFAGALDVDQVRPASSRIKSGVSVFTGVWPPGDHRDWGAINLWAESLHPFLLFESPAARSIFVPSWPAARGWVPR